MALPAQAERVIWRVDSTNSLIVMTIPDQDVPVPDVGDVSIRFRDAGSATAWTTNGGRRAYLAGEIVSDYVDGVSISFRGGEHDLHALETTALRPNPASWNADTGSYTNATTAPAALGARIRGNYTLLTFDMAFLALRSMTLDLANADAAPIALSGGAFPGGLSLCGIERALADVDGLGLPLNLGQPVPDLLSAELLPGLLTNATGGVINSLGGLERQLTYSITLTNLTIDLDGTLLTGSVSGQIVAHATLPGPQPALEVALQAGAVVLAWPTSASGFTLQVSPTLNPASWNPAPPAPVVVNGHYVVTNEVTGPRAFYRLWKP